MQRLMVALLVLVSCCGGSLDVPGTVAVAHAAMPTYEARIRLKGSVSTTTVQARDAGHAKRLVQAQFGPDVQVLSVKRLK